jgi:hypothetical protein
MSFYYTRYGDGDDVSTANEDAVMTDLLRELRHEQFDTPDDEHTQVSIGNEHWSVTAQVSGLITFDNIDIVEGLESDLPENLYLRDVPDSQLKDIWRAVIRGDRKSLFSHPWVPLEELSPYEKDYYRCAA